MITPAEKHRRGTVPPLGSPQGRAGPGGEGTGGAGAASSSSGRRAAGPGREQHPAPWDSAEQRPARSAWTLRGRGGTRTVIAE